ncbi:hypothetical protein [Wolbachia endosymbiont of Trichogramma kaykai]
MYSDDSVIIKNLEEDVVKNNKKVKIGYKQSKKKMSIKRYQKILL